jgi:hypothetical protein
MFGGWLSPESSNQNETLIMDCFVLFRENKTDNFQLMGDTPFTEWGCRMCKLGFESQNPNGEAIVVKIVV